MDTFDGNCRRRLQIGTADWSDDRDRRPPNADRRLTLARVALLAGALTLATGASAWAQSATWLDHVVYVLIPHKFFDGDPSNNYMKVRYDLPNPGYEGGFLGGDVRGVRQKMDYLKGLGVNAVLLYPMFKNDERDFFGFLPTGYRVTDYRSIDPNFGSNSDFLGMVADFHSTANGPRLSVIVDLPIGMTGFEHRWFTSASAYPWYYRPWNAAAPSENIGDQPTHLPYGDVDNSFALPIINHTLGMDTASGPYRALRDIVFGIADTGVDGIRYDSAQNFHGIFWSTLLREFRARYSASRPDFVHVAEAFVTAPKRSWQIWPDDFMDNLVHDLAVGQVKVDGVYDFGLIKVLQDVFGKGLDVENLVDHINLQAVFFEHPERLIASLDNYEADSFLQNVANGSGGSKMALAAVFLLTINRVPLIYSGNEYAVDYTTPGTLFGPGLDEDYFARFKQLIAIRRDEAAFRRGSLQWLDRTSTILSYKREDPGGRFVVVLNNNDTLGSQTIALGTRGIIASGAENLLKAGDANVRLSNPGTTAASLTVTMEAWEAKIIRLTAAPASLADLTITALTAPSNASPGATISVTGTVMNQGTAAAGGSTMTLYLSSNQILDGSAVPLRTQPLPALSAGASLSGSPPVRIPAATSTGRYYIIAKVDSGNIVAESEEGNNTHVIPIEIVR